MRKTIAALFLLAAATARAQEPDLVLVPLSVQDVRGANGSVWATELWAVDRSGESVVVDPLPCRVATDGCQGGLTIIANRSLRFAPLANAEKPGILVRAPATTSFTLHVRDLSRQSESWGTEIPVVREKDFFTSPTTVTNIPSGASYRQTLRLYAIARSGDPVHFRLKLYGVTATNDQLLREDLVTLDAPLPPPPDRLASPLTQGTVTNLFAIEIASIDRLRVTVEPQDDPPVPYWTFVSITNNTTQQVTTATPR